MLLILLQTNSSGFKEVTFYNLVMQSKLFYLTSSSSFLFFFYRWNNGLTWEIALQADSQKYFWYICILRHYINLTQFFISWGKCFISYFVCRTMHECLARDEIRAGTGAIKMKVNLFHNVIRARFLYCSRVFISLSYFKKTLRQTWSIVNIGHSRIFLRVKHVAILHHINIVSTFNYYRVIGVHLPCIFQNVLDPCNAHFEVCLS